MIVSANSGIQFNDFEALLAKSVSLLQDQSLERKEYFLSRKGTKLEKDVFEVMMLNSMDTPFEGNLEMISGQRFPDIVAYLNKTHGFGVEVKTTNQNHWRSIGNSVFEGTRVENIDRIYLFFGKLTEPIEFRCKRYEECLYDVAVTHSPRYLIDMEVSNNETIFDKVNMSYDELRSLKNPFQPIKSYYRNNILKEGDDIWWIESDEVAKKDFIIQYWRNVEPPKKAIITSQAMVLFPEVFAPKNPNKYRRIAGWLVTKHQVVCSNVRDIFSGSGRVTIEFNDEVFEGVPRVFGNLEKYLGLIFDYIEKADNEDLLYYWGESVSELDRIEYWIDLVSKYSKPHLEGTGLNIDNFLNIKYFEISE